MKKRKKLKIKVRWLLYGLILGFVVVFSLYHAIYAKMVIPGVTILGRDMGGTNYPQLLSDLSIKASTKGPIALKYLDNNFNIPNSDIDLNYNIPKTAKNAFNAGRTGNFILDIKSKFTGIYKPINVSFDYEYNKDKLVSKIIEISLQIENPHKDAAFIFDTNGNLTIEPELTGLVVDKDALKLEIEGRLSNVSSDNIVITVSNYVPKLTESDLLQAAPKMQKLLDNLPIFVFQGSTFSIEGSDFTEMVYPEKEGEKVVLKVNNDRVKKFVTSIAEEVNRPPKSEIFQVEGTKVIDFRLPTPGYVVKEYDAVEIFSLALLDPSMERQIEVPFEEFLPSASANSYGIKELLGEGYSTYVGSIAGRIHNIELAAKNLNGLLVAPGETFSFNNGVGPIDYAHGFTSAYIISKGRTVLGEGGGVCQVSTTLFRAMLDSGLPVISRTAHAYRVSYYEQKYPVGFDATVYQPTVDLKFKNDTQNYVLIQSEVIPKESKLIFRLYGTGDGRKATIEGPTIFSQTPPPEPLYQDDPSLSEGVTKQVDWSAWGAIVEIKRKVEKDGKVIYSDTFKSNFQPWRAVYLVGTAE